MLTKFTVDYILFPQHNSQVSTHRTDDPVEMEDFLVSLLSSGSRILTIRHDAQEVSSQQFDHMIKVAAERLMSFFIERSLDIDSAQVRHRFHFAA